MKPWLHDTYPHDFANKVQHANVDVEVPDNFTGETAFGCALADGEMISAAISVAAQSQWRKRPRTSVEMF